MKKLEIFDPAMCCPTGVCGPSVDPELTRIASSLFSLEKKGFSINRYNLASEPMVFAENEVVNKTLHEKGPDALPITLLNGEVLKVGTYPTNGELSSWLEVEEKEFTEAKPKIRLI
jgi:hypothetical protein